MRVLGFKGAASFIVSYQDTFTDVSGAFSSKDCPVFLGGSVFI